MTKWGQAPVAEYDVIKSMRLFDCHPHSEGDIVLGIIIIIVLLVIIEIRAPNCTSLRKTVPRDTTEPLWWRSIVVRPPVLAGELSLDCADFLPYGGMTTLWVKRPLSVNQHGQLSKPSLRSVVG